MQDVSLHDEMAYGCLFCITGNEMAVANQIQFLYPTRRAVAARQEKFKSVNGKKFKVEAVLLPGYVFFQAPRNMLYLPWLRLPDVIRVLKLDGAWQLFGDDERFAKWIFQYDGLLGFSKAYKEGERIRIHSGPLKDMEGQIQRIDKRGRSGQVALEFDNKTIMVWLGFDLLDSVSLEVPRENV